MSEPKETRKGQPLKREGERLKLDMGPLDVHGVRREI